MIQLEDGDIILVKVNKFKTWYKYLLAKAIQFFDGVYYHHAQMYFEGAIWEANETVQRNSTLVNRGDDVIVFRLKKRLRLEEHERLKEFLEKSKGRNYDYLGTMFFQVLYILTFRRIWLGPSGRHARKHYYCTELVTRPMRDIRGYFPQSHKIGPSTLLDLLPLHYNAVYEGVWD